MGMAHWLADEIKKASDERWLDCLTKD
ncbi:hypothetical protein PANT111_320002 [Pantoea brenneri]|uniref:Transposase n=1 Tax=Pantoea brenneri TaxID=472694 RepID=A0AAX3J9V0_9GAMM|nr:hypothetical protein PANT111_320002 [Pantoea brenneri]